MTRVRANSPAPAGTPRAIKSLPSSANTYSKDGPMSKDKIVGSLPAVCAIVAICIIEIYALSKGLNGRCMTVAVAGIAGVGGFTLKGLLEK